MCEVRKKKYKNTHKLNQFIPVNEETTFCQIKRLGIHINRNPKYPTSNSQMHYAYSVVSHLRELVRAKQSNPLSQPSQLLFIVTLL